MARPGVSTNHSWRLGRRAGTRWATGVRTERGTRTMARAGQLRMKSATVREVARRAGVSPMTVSRVVNGSRRVRPETRVAVEKVIAALGYVPNGLARGLTSRKTGVLGLIVPDVSNPFYAPIVRGAESVARRAAFHVILCNSESNLAYEGEYISAMLRQRIEGVLIAPVGDGSRTHLLHLERHHTPFVLIDRSVNGIECDVVQADSVGGARRLVEHLISLGHRRIGMIAEGTSVSTSRDRRRGYQDALDAAGIPVDGQLLVVSTVDLPGGYQGMQRLLDLETRPTAVFAINNLVAVGAMKAIRERGVRVPEDIALVAFDDIEHVASLWPFLTVIPQPAETFGVIAAQLLLERIAGRGAEQRRVVILPSDPIVRESCGARLVGAHPSTRENF
jgi:LacI family transcriptional regulator